MSIRIAIAIAVALFLVALLVAGVLLLDEKGKPVVSGQATQQSNEETGGSK